MPQSNNRQLDFFETFELPETRVSGHTFKSFKRPIWTEDKAKLIERYLYYFVMITKHGNYIDGFSGPQSQEAVDGWSAKLVLESEPKWLRHFYLCDIDPKQIQQLRDLKESQPPRKKKEPARTVEIYEGDFNSKIDEILSSEHITEKSACFCLLDQRTFECDWATVEKIAAKKKQNKIEIFYFISSGWFERAVSGLGDKSSLEKWWGRQDWDSLTKMRAHERAEVMCERFKEQLAYKFAYAWPIYEKGAGQGRIMYHMVHASDHNEAPNLMARAYRKALQAPEPINQFELELRLWRESRR